MWYILSFGIRHVSQDKTLWSLGYMLHNVFSSMTLRCHHSNNFCDWVPLTAPWHFSGKCYYNLKVFHVHWTPYYKNILWACVFLCMLTSCKVIEGFFTKKFASSKTKRYESRSSLYWFWRENDFFVKVTVVSCIMCIWWNVEYWIILSVKHLLEWIIKTGSWRIARGTRCKKIGLLKRTRSLPPASEQVRRLFAETGSDIMIANESLGQLWSLVNQQELTVEKRLMVRVANTRRWCLFSEELLHWQRKNWPFDKGIITRGSQSWLCCE